MGLAVRATRMSVLSHCAACKLPVPGPQMSVTLLTCLIGLPAGLCLGTFDLGPDPLSVRTSRMCLFLGVFGILHQH